MSALRSGESARGPATERHLKRLATSPGSTTFQTGASDDEARRGLRLFASVVGGVCVASFGMQLLGEVVLGTMSWSRADWLRESGEAIAQGGLAFVLFRAAGMPSLSMAVKRGLALALYILYVGISTTYDVVYLDTANFTIRPGWTCLAVLMYALLAPGSVRHHAIVAAGAVAATPLGAMIGWATGLVHDAAGGRPPFGYTATSALAATAPAAVCAIVAMFIVVSARRRATKFEAMARKLQSMGSYRLIRRLGEGGMGEVWLGEHSFLATPAAVKLIRPELLTRAGDYEAPSVLLERFSREAHTIANLTSQHTVRLFDFGHADDGTFFFVMELLDGEDLESIVRRTGPLPEARVIHLLRHACDSLGEAHAAGLVHRDIKPANLFVCRKGLRRDVLKVLDFGLALHVEAMRPEAEPSGERKRLTEQGLVQGTAWYMAPEQAMSGDGLDHRVDIYALGCVAYFLLTGTEVFRASSAMKVLMMHCTQAPEPPSKRTPENPVSPAFEALILDMLAKDRDDRPFSTTHVLERLRALPTPRWTARDAEAWHATHAPGDAAPPRAVAVAPTADPRPPSTDELAARPDTPVAGPRA